MSEKPLILYAASTGNGIKVPIFLEELRAAYGSPDYDLKIIDMKIKEQKQPWFLEVSPNGTIPALTDRSRGNFHVFESGAILLYLARHYDKEGKFSFNEETEEKEHSEMVQWMFFVHSFLGPMHSQVMFWTYFTPQELPFARERYVGEMKRLYGVLDTRLKDRDYLVGPGRGKYTLLDVTTWSTVTNHAFAKIATDLGEWPALKAWYATIKARAPVQAGLKAVAP